MRQPTLQRPSSPLPDSQLEPLLPPLVSRSALTRRVNGRRLPEKEVIPGNHVAAGRATGPSSSAAAAVPKGEQAQQTEQGEAQDEDGEGDAPLLLQEGEAPLQ